MSCPYCASADVRSSHTSFGLDRIGLHRVRCRSCNGLFWLRRAGLEAARARRHELFDAPVREEEPAERPARPMPALDAEMAATPGAPDLDALDRDLAGRRSEAPPR